MAYETFGFSEEQILMRDSILGLLGRALPAEKMLEFDKNSSFPEEAFQAVAADGWLGLPIVEAYGGAGASNMDMAVFIEALGYYHYGIRSAYMTTSIYGASHLQYHASEVQRREMLPRLIKGQLKMCIAYSEPESGSDAAGIRTRALRNGDGYVINGQKIYITNAHVSDWMVVSAKTDPDARHKGLSLFLVDSKTPGLTIQPMDPLGSRTSLPNEVFFDDVRIPAENLLGSEGGAWPMLMRGLNQERLLLAATSAGACMRILELAKDFATSRKAFGRTITEYQAVSHKLADMYMLTEGARLATFHAARMLDAGEDAVMETTTAKVVATENNFKVADLGMQIMGGAGYMAGEMQRLFREARLGPIGGGTSEILRNVIAKRMGL
ncbi:MAG: acyl-CoA dehydrogenase family protein [Alphaproteobacteria bacterium]|jgi:alkylation response protein AidB-like acyl-CoA dehydrogenase|nr:acyl-CoA dehydrogenase [Rhodospirillaceae bacterium]MDP6021919.1 acyl-CoA dehydrogenase family protein [Alphaproteobacteria bacterium]MDP6254117.1 acyl-CoA dehydrogenase family protein [Alphaproteobacteria bacterium]MDP7054629.1 acyl-CoA dehydrogenase family protein [Alphaproteobacteria bacterium]MDP7228589.1 acyl-CoA dehydrogenase family protein [Alphaproteobacteria bacterium]|tara:strand:+ start:1031 stop:2176 length:1146 start_codon:yes stop_codon:yes gene_type:complete